MKTHPQPLGDHESHSPQQEYPQWRGSSLTEEQTTLATKKTLINFFRSMQEHEDFQLLISHIVDENDPCFLRSCVEYQKLVQVMFNDAEGQVSRRDWLVRILGKTRMYRHKEFSRVFPTPKQLILRLEKSIAFSDIRNLDQVLKEVWSSTELKGFVNQMDANMRQSNFRIAILALLQADPLLRKKVKEICGTIMQIKVRKFQYQASLHEKFNEIIDCSLTAIQQNKLEMLLLQGLQSQTLRLQFQPNIKEKTLEIVLAKACDCIRNTSQGQHFRILIIKQLASRLRGKFEKEITEQKLKELQELSKEFKQTWIKKLNEVQVNLQQLNSLTCLLKDNQKMRKMIEPILSDSKQRMLIDFVERTLNQLPPSHEREEPNRDDRPPEETTVSQRIRFRSEEKEENLDQRRPKRTAATEQMQPEQEDIEGHKKRKVEHS